MSEKPRIPVVTSGGVVYTIPIADFGGKGGFLRFRIGCPARIRTSIDGIRIRSLTIRRRGTAEPAI